MKKFTVTVLVLFLWGCATPYQKPQSGDTAILILPEKEGPYERSFHIGKLNENGCVTDTARVKAESYSEKDMVHIPAGSEIVLSVRSHSNSTSCTGSSVMKLEKNKTYDAVVLTFPLVCTFTIIEKNSESESSVLKTQSLSRGCVKK